MRWVRFVGQCTFTQQGNPYRFAGIAQDVTGMMITQKKESVNERFKHAIEQAPMAILILKGKDMVLETANPAMLKIMDRGIDSIGQPLEAIMPELSGQALLAIWLPSVFTCPMVRSQSTLPSYHQFWLTGG